MESALERTDLHGKSFYPAGVIAAYCVVFLPVGFLLYGLNLLRRRSLAMGWTLAVLSLVLGIGVVASVAVYGRSVEVFFFAVFSAIAILKMEGPHYHNAVKRGGSRARWWPPMILVLAAVITAGAISFALEPTVSAP